MNFDSVKTNSSEYFSRGESILHRDYKVTPPTCENLSKRECFYKKLKIFTKKLLTK